MKCRVCRGPAVIDLRRHNANFCSEHFLRFAREQVARAIDDFEMLEPGDRVLVAVSGGKDSLAVWDILRALGYDADGLYIGLGIGEYSAAALLIALVTFLVTHYLLKVSIYIPAPLIAIGIGILLSGALQDGEHLTLIRDKFGAIPTNFLILTPPVLPAWDLGVLRDLAYLVVAIVFVSGVESLLCSRMADRLADNRGTPYNPNKEFWGQGMVQVTDLGRLVQ